jgi:hypothetical protein
MFSLEIKNMPKSLEFIFLEHSHCNKYGSFLKGCIQKDTFREL